MKKIVFMDEKQNKLKNNTIKENISHRDQQILINKLYLENDEKDDKIKPVVQLLKNKHNSYKAQDKKNKIYGKDFFITFDELILKLVESKLICFYCKEQCYICYNYAYEDSQWTLERNDNNLGHTNNNTIISCLKCNLERKNLCREKFIETKKIKCIRKLE
jgi:hypothetical protein